MIIIYIRHFGCIAGLDAMNGNVVDFQCAGVSCPPPGGQRWPGVRKRNEQFGFNGSHNLSRAANDTSRSLKLGRPLQGPSPG